MEQQVFEHKHRKEISKAEARKSLEFKTDDTLTVDPATQELARRELSRRKLIEFVMAFHPRYKAGWVHRDICNRLEKFSREVDEGKSPRLMILMPPRHGKSQLASKLYPAWHLGHFPHHEFIGCSYNIPLALDFSREVRDVIKSEKYNKIFPKTQLNPDFQSAEAWRLQSATGVGAGGYNAAGIMGGITGKGAHVLVIDDPVKNAEEAESADLRQKIWNWYLTSAYTRLAPGGGVLVIQTWWHDDDLAGRLQREMHDDPEADQFVIVKYPAIAEEDEQYRLKGEALHPERFTLEMLNKTKRLMGGTTSRYWSALYQQNPVSDEGAYFTDGMFKHVDELPQIKDMDIYQAWDFAISEKQHNDFTVGTTVGVDSNDNMYVIEVVRIKTSDAAVIIEAVLDMYKRYPRVKGFGAEDSQIWRTLRKGLERRAVQKKIYIHLDEKLNILKPVSDKMVRARPLQARMSSGKVFFPRGKSWYDDVKTEFLRFPAGIHDDIVDSLAWNTQLLSKSGPPPAVKYRGSSRELTLEQKLSRLNHGNGSISHMSS